MLLHIAYIAPACLLNIQLTSTAQRQQQRRATQSPVMGACCAAGQVNHAHHARTLTCSSADWVHIRWTSICIRAAATPLSQSRYKMQEWQWGGQLHGLGLTEAASCLIPASAFQKDTLCPCASRWALFPMLRCCGGYKSWLSCKK